MNDHHLVADTKQPVRDEQGMSTAEYAVGTVSACGFGGILFKILTSEWGQDMLTGILDKVVDLLPF